MKTLALIPARGGSVRIPGKNMIDLGGVPLIEWTIRAAECCAKHLTEIAVTSDDARILAYARKRFVTAIQRPSHIATGDSRGSRAAIQHALLTSEQEFDVVLLLQPTSPFRSTDDIMLAIHVLQSGEPSVVSCRVGKTEPNGAIYGTRTKPLLRGAPLYDEYSRRIFMPEHRSIDIDTFDDLDAARRMLIHV